MVEPYKERICDMPNLITSNYTSIDVHAQGGILVTTSRNVAQVFGKEHFNVLRDIENVIAQLPKGQNSDLSSGLNKPFSQNADLRSGLFISSAYKTEPNGRDYPEYLITKDGLTLLVMGYTGEKAMAFKLAYIKRFNEMEAMLKDIGGSALTLERTLNIARMVLEPAGITGNQLTISLDNLVKAKTGESLLALTGVELVRPQQVHLATPTEIGRRLAAARGVEKISGIAVNQMLAAKGYQESVDKKWVATELGKQAGATYLDVGKAHSKGTPVTQLKWPIDILDNLD